MNGGGGALRVQGTGGDHWQQRAETAGMKGEHALFVREEKPLVTLQCEREVVSARAVRSAPSDRPGSVDGGGPNFALALGGGCEPFLTGSAPYPNGLISKLGRSR